MQITNTKERYGIVAITLHWVVAILIICLVCVGLYMTRIPISFQKLKLYGMHKEFGITVLMLAMLRIVWRIGNIKPLLPPNMLRWHVLAAESVHWAFYVFMFALPITGWIISSSAGLPVSYFGLFTLPDLVAANEQYRVVFTQIHHWLAFALIATFFLHVFAALWHHFYEKDTVLRRMLP